MASFLTTLFTAAAVFSSVANGLAKPLHVRDVSITGVIEWHGTSNGQEVTLYGTAAEILVQLKAADPNWVPANSGVDKTKRTQSGNVNCCPVPNMPWEYVPIEDVQIAMNQLTELGGVCGSAPRSCNDAEGSNGIISCRAGAGISICNDKYDVIYPSCAQIAAYADEIITSCPHSVTGGVCGQVFDDGNYNVVVSQC